MKFTRNSVPLSQVGGRYGGAHAHSHVSESSVPPLLHTFPLHGAENKFFMYHILNPMFYVAKKMYTARD